VGALSELLSREEIMEKQRSRMDWPKDGDCNTTFFQAKAKAKAKERARKTKYWLCNGRMGLGPPNRKS
jgi:hypothetical protein